ncbi:MAG: hypothetical protein LBD75_00170 [Candidatus Peribacteria bacterium]|jgi:hypothetical protein|nr:hypothetical protein [Candidatus Peribacteria bacterium]
MKADGLNKLHVAFILSIPMYQTTKSFYQHYLSRLPASELFSYVQVIEYLLQVYGIPKLKTSTFLHIIKASSPALYTLLFLLIQHKTLTQPFLTSLKNLLSLHINPAELHFTISSPSVNVNTQLEKQLKKQFKKSDISLIASAEMGLKVQGGRLSYERSLEKDLKKLFRR